jgi:hypothetical protein
MDIRSLLSQEVAFNVKGEDDRNGAMNWPHLLRQSRGPMKL